MSSSDLRSGEAIEASASQEGLRGDSTSSRPRTLSRRSVLLGGTVGAASLAGAGIGGWEVARSSSRATTNSKVAAPTTAAAEFRSRPDLSPPHLQAAVLAAERTPGLVMMTPSLVPGVRGLDQSQAVADGKGQMGLSIVQPHGEIVWFTPTDSLSTNLQVQTYRNNPVLTYWTGTVDDGIGYGAGYLLDSAYEQVATVKAGNGLRTDLHDLTLTPQHTALITAYRIRSADLSPVGGPARGSVYDSIAQEIDIASGKVLFEWSSLDHVPVEDSYYPVAPSPMDYFHINSVALWDETSLLISSRNTWTVYRVDRRTGEIIWRIGGKRSDFSIGTGAAYQWQHHVRRTGTSSMSVFDDAATPAEAQQSRGLILHVDERSKRVTLDKAYTHPAKLLTDYEGSVQVLPNGHVFVGWGTEPYSSEFDSDGHLIVDLRLPTNDQSYRVWLSWSDGPDGASPGQRHSPALTAA